MVLFSDYQVQMYESTFNFQLFVPGGGTFFRLLAFKIEVGVTTYTPLINFLSHIYAQFATGGGGILLISKVVWGVY
jgi:hypothetical protein